MTLAEEIRLTADQIRETARPSRPAPSQPAPSQPAPSRPARSDRELQELRRIRDWSGTARQIQTEIDQLMQMYESKTTPRYEHDTSHEPQPDKTQRLKMICKLLAAEL